MVADFTKNGSSGSERAGAIGLLLTIAVLTFVLQFFSVHVKQTRKRNRLSRNKLFKRLGLEIKGVPRRTVIGFFHPYWYVLECLSYLHIIDMYTFFPQTAMPEVGEKESSGKLSSIIWDKILMQWWSYIPEM
jgi:hypothetical protein